MVMLAGIIILAGCTDLDDIYRRLDDQKKEFAAFEAQLKKFEQLTNNINSEITSIKRLVDALNKKVSVVSYKELDDKSGYELTLSDGSKITLKHGAKGDKGDPGKKGEQGKKGDDGIAPAINVKLDTDDGLLYWTVNDDWLLDANGNKVPAQGKDGEDGEQGAPGADGFTPLLRINADFYWEMSLDKGRTWEAIIDASDNPISAQGPKGEPGQDGDANLTITETDDAIIIVYKDVTYTLPKGEKPVEPKMVLTTAKSVGSTIRLLIDAAEADRHDVWIDLNNNGFKDPGEKVTSFGDIVEYTLDAQTITVYGKVVKFFCNEVELTSLEVSKNRELTLLSCNSNQLSTLNLLKNTKLTKLYCGNNKLTALDVSNNTELTLLECSINRLTELDVTKNQMLTILMCTNNQITTLSVSGNEELTHLYCCENKISGGNMTSLVNNLPDRTGKPAGEFWVFAVGSDSEQNIITAAQATVATGKNWLPMDGDGDPYTPPGDTPPGDILNPLSLVAKYNVNTAGTGFVTDLTDCEVSGYFTFDEADSKFTPSITIGGKKYHLPSREEWCSIVPRSGKFIKYQV